MKSGSNVNGVWVEEFDTDTGTHTRRSEDGKVLSTRALTADEMAELIAADNETRIRVALTGSDQFDALRQVASGTGQFATNAGRDAAIRACARGLVAIIRLTARRLDATD